MNKTGIKSEQRVWTIGTTSTVVLPSRPQRQGVLIANQAGSNTLYVVLGPVATSTGVPVVQNGSYEQGEGDYTGTISLIASGSGTTVQILETFYES